MASNGEIDSMINLRIQKAAEKKNDFHTFLECMKVDYVKNNPGKKFKNDFVNITEELWESLTDEQISVYQELNEKERRLIDFKCNAAFDEQIVSARPGTRKYGAADLETQFNIADNSDIKKFTFNPIYWYTLELHGNNAVKPDNLYDWKEDVCKLQRQAAKKWEDLAQEERNKFVNLAKQERRIFYKKKGTMISEEENERVIQVILETSKGETKERANYYK